MLEHYLATLLRLGQPRDLAHSALRRSQKPASPTGSVEAAAPAGPPVAPGADRSSEWDLDQELDAWEAEHRWLYR